MVGVAAVIQIEGRTHGAKEVNRMYAAAPGAFFKAIRHRMYSERKRYIGTRGSAFGKFRKQLMRKRHAGKNAFGRGGKWPENVAKAFKGYLRGEKMLDGMSMHMGSGLKKRSKFVKGLEMMDKSATNRTISGKGKYMPVPAYRNIGKHYRGPMSRAFRAMAGRGDLVPVKRGGRIFWFHKNGRYKQRKKSGMFKRSALMFIGQKMIKISPQFDFNSYMKGESPRMLVRARREIDGTVRRLNRGIIKSGDFSKTPDLSFR